MSPSPLVRPTAVLLASLGLLVGARTIHAADDTAVRHIIPHHKIGAESCFEGTFTDKALDMTGWPTYAEQAKPKRNGDGSLAESSKRHDLPGQSVSAVTLHLTFTDAKRRENQSWDLGFVVRLKSPSLGHDLFAQSGCTWSGWDYTKQQEVSPDFMLACWIECDGGGMRAVRVPGTRDLNVFFSSLFMQSGCEGGGRYSVAISEASKDVAFRLARAPLKACRPLKAWAREQSP